MSNNFTKKDYKEWSKDFRAAQNRQPHPYFLQDIINEGLRKGYLEEDWTVLKFKKNCFGVIY